MSKAAHPVLARLCLDIYEDKHSSENKVIRVGQQGAWRAEREGGRYWVEAKCLQLYAAWTVPSGECVIGDIRMCQKRSHDAPRWTSYYFNRAVGMYDIPCERAKR